MATCKKGCPFAKIGKAVNEGYPRFVRLLTTQITKNSQTMKKLITLTVAILAGMAFSANAADAKALYENKKCVQCHGADGKGDTKMGKKAGCKDLTDAKVQAELKDDKAFKSVKDGMKDGDKEIMKSFADKLSDDEIKALIAHVRSFKK